MPLQIVADDGFTHDVLCKANQCLVSWLKFVEEHYEKL